MVDAIRETRLRNERANLLGMRNPRLHLQPADTLDRYLLTLDVKTLVAEDGASPEVFDGPCVIEMFFPALYPAEDPPIFLVHNPRDLFHPNGKRGAHQLFCLGDLTEQRADVIVGALVGSLGYHDNLYSMDERDAFNIEAARWAREHQDILPIDPRPFAGNFEQDATG